MFFYYIKEIKYRSCLVIITWISTFLISYIYKEFILFFCIKSTLHSYNNSLFYFIFTDITEIFSTYIKLIYFISNQITLFVLIFHIFIFISPGLYRYEYKKIKTILIISFNIWFFFNFVLNNFLLPICWKFFLKFQQENSNIINFYFEAKFIEYLNFYLWLYRISILIIIIFIFIFIYLDIYNDNNNYFNISTIRKYFYFLFFIIATITTPPDILSQLIVGFIFILLFEFLVIIDILKKIYYGNQLKLSKIPDVNIK